MARLSPAPVVSTIGRSSAGGGSWMTIGPTVAALHEHRTARTHAEHDVRRGTRGEPGHGSGHRIVEVGGGGEEVVGRRDEVRAVGVGGVADVLQVHGDGQAERAGPGHDVARPVGQGREHQVGAGQRRLDRGLGGGRSVMCDPPS